MATELEGNETLQRFIALLCALNNQCATFLKSGEVSVLVDMNDAVEEMHEIQSVGTEEAYTAIEEDMQIIYKNFNAVVTMLHSHEGEEFDASTSGAVHLFVRNIFDANVRIVIAYGLA